MASELRFLVDMGIGQSVVEWLLVNSYDAVHVRVALNKKASDESIFAFASAQGLIVLTCDLDFSDIMIASKQNQPSIIILRLEDETPMNIIERLKKILPNAVHDLKTGCIISINESRYRIRKMPLE